MAGKVQIRCINKTDRLSPHERIKNIGGTNHDGGKWKLTLNEAIQSIKNDKYSFFVSVNGNSVDVIIANHTGYEYLKTKNDGEQPNNLLSLPECP